MTRRDLHVPAVTVLVAAFLDGPWQPGWMAARAAHDLGVDGHPILRRLAEVAVIRFPSRPDDQHRRVTAALSDSPALDEFLAWTADTDALGAKPHRRRRVATGTGGMQPGPWPVLALNSDADLGAALGLPPTMLEWFADVRGLERTAPEESLRHYRYRWIAKQSGGGRLIEAPKPRLKAIQRFLLREVIDHIPPHDAAHGFRSGRSVHTFAAPHVDRAVVIGLDLESFFTAVPLGRVFRTFVAAGYPDLVAHTLTALCANSAPPAVRRAAPPMPAQQRPAWWRMMKILAFPHLPQGAPTSPALANLAAQHMDVRVAAAGAHVGGRYTRYADDLAISGGEELRRSAGWLITAVAAIARDEGFRLNQRKTRVVGRSERQMVGGLVVNERANVRRSDYDRLRAILHDAVHHGPTAANRSGVDHFRDHLLGHIAWVSASNPDRGSRLRAMFDAVDWTI